MTRKDQLTDLFLSVDFLTKTGMKPISESASNWRDIVGVLCATPFSRVPLDEIKMAAAWTIGNPKKAKTRLGAFIINWFRGWLERHPEEKANYHKEL